MTKKNIIVTIIAIIAIAIVLFFTIPSAKAVVCACDSNITPFPTSSISPDPTAEPTNDPTITDEPSSSPSESPTDTPTVTPTPTATSGGTGGGDGLSDGKSSCPECTKAPQVPAGPPATGRG